MLLWAVVMGLSIRMTATLMSRFQDQYHDPFVRSAFAVTALAFVFVALPAFAYWLFALFFSHESWPIGRKRQR